MVVFGCLLLHERFNLSRLLSVVLATVGVLLIVVDPDNMRSGSLLGGNTTAAEKLALANPRQGASL